MNYLNNELNARRCSDIGAKIRLALMAAMMLLAMSLTAGQAAIEEALAAEMSPLITYDGATGEMACYAEEGTDLFPAFKQLMPGDSAQQTVRLQVTNTKGKVRLFVQAKAGTGTDALAALELHAKSDTADTVGSVGAVFAESVLLAEFEGVGEKTLNMELVVPASIGNELADLNEHLIWVFTAQDEGEPTDPGPVDPADPADDPSDPVNPGSNSDDKGSDNKKPGNNTSGINQPGQSGDMGTGSIGSGAPGVGSAHQASVTSDQARTFAKTSDDATLTAVLASVLVLAAVFIMLAFIKRKHKDSAQ